MVGRLDVASSRSSVTCTQSSRVGHDDERLDAALGVVAEALDDRQAEPEGLARAGLRLADDVLAGEGEGDGLFLDGEGIDDALPGECVDDVGRDAEFGESGQESACRCCLKVTVRCAPFSTPGARPRIHRPRAASTLSETAWETPICCLRGDLVEAGAVPRPEMPRLRPRVAPTELTRVDFTELVPEPVAFLGQAAYIQLEFFEALARAVATAPDARSRKRG